MIILLRLSVALPAVALDESKTGLGEAWSATKSNGIRLLVISITTAIPFTAALELIEFAGRSVPPAGGLIVLHLVLLKPLSLAIELLSVLVAVTLLSLAYAFLIENREAGTTTPVI